MQVRCLVVERVEIFTYIRPYVVSSGHLSRLSSSPELRDLSRRLVLCGPIVVLVPVV